MTKNLPIREENASDWLIFCQKLEKNCQYNMINLYFSLKMTERGKNDKNKLSLCDFMHNGPRVKLMGVPEKEITKLC